MSYKSIQSQLTDPDNVRSNWQAIVSEIEKSLEAEESPEGRDMLFSLFQATMDFAETGVSVDELCSFQEARKKRFGGYLLREAIIGDQICAETLDAVTRREVAAGRLASDDPLRVFAIHSLAAPHSTREELLAKASEK